MTETHRNEILPLIDPQILLDDNRSREAQRGIVTFYQAQETGRVTHFETCSDARAHPGSFVGDQAISVHPTIAAAGDTEFMKYSIKHPGIEQIFVLEHFYGPTVTTSDFPKGCGGREDKLDIIKKQATPTTEGVLGYIDTMIEHPGVYKQSVISALEVSGKTSMPVLAGGLDHGSGKIYPFVLIEHGQIVASSVPKDKFGDPAYIYKNGIPVLKDSELPESIQRILLENKRRVKELAQQYPNFLEAQKTQDPQAIVISTSIIPTTTRYPGLFGEPNTNFGIILPYLKSGSAVVTVHSKGFKDVLAQLEYPVGNAITSQSGHGGHGFASTHRIIIETPNIVLSEQVGDIISHQTWMKPWLDLPMNEIWVAQVSSGQTDIAEVYR